MNQSGPDAPWFADLAVDGARSGGDLLTYAVPSSLAGSLQLGDLVWVGVRKRWGLAVVLRLHDEEPSFATKPIEALVDPPLRLAPDRIETARWMARETSSSLFAACAPFLPPGLASRACETVRLADPLPPLPALTTAQRRLVEFLGERGESQLEAARAALGSSLASVVPKLDEAGIVVRSVRGGWEPPTPKPQRFVRLLAPVAVERAPRQQAVVDDLVRRSRLAPSGDPPLVPLPDLLARTGSDHAVVGALARKGVVEEVTVARPLALVTESSEPVPTLTAAQAGAWRSIEDALAARDPTPFLLHGVTGSGKTEVYLRAIGWCVRHDRSAIVLAPEIALASQVVRRVTARFPGRVAVLHSALPEAERAATWAAIAAGQMPVVVGPRSALFAPVDNLGLVVLDEEHDGAYKQDAEPRYHARPLAEEIGRRRGAVVVLGSATPAVETTWRAEDGQVRLLRLPDRVGPSMAGGDDRRTGEALELPPVETVDLRLELHRGNPLLLGERLFETLQRTLARHEQAILFLNRRGMATVVLCRSCGRTLLCPYCDIPLVYHADRGWLLCHRCDLRQPPAAACSECGGGLNYFGAGTQRVEQEVRRVLPGARVLRWDQDTVRRRGGHEALLRQVELHEVDIVVGTQMIAKGLDLPLVTAVGVVNADTMLHLPDFRSAERTFQLLTQVAGRAGRRGPGSVVIVQSYTPDHYAIRAASRHDYAAFYGEEIAFRRTHRYPPFVRLVRYLVRDPDEARCAAQADEMARRLARHARDRGVEMDLLGPTPAFATKSRGLYQWQIVLRTEDLERLLDGLPAPPGWAVDVDPQSLL